MAYVFKKVEASEQTVKDAMDKGDLMGAMVAYRQWKPGQSILDDQKLFPQLTKVAEKHEKRNRQRV